MILNIHTNNDKFGTIFISNITLNIIAELEANICYYVRSLIYLNLYLAAKIEFMISDGIDVHITLFYERKNNFLLRIDMTSD